MPRSVLPEARADEPGGRHELCLFGLRAELLDVGNLVTSRDSGRRGPARDVSGQPGMGQIVWESQEPRVGS